MKTFKFKWLLLNVILSLASINTARADGYEYGMQYLYIDASACSWWADDSAQPCLNAYWNTACNDEDIYQGAADGNLETRIWYFNLSNMNASYAWFRGFKVQRHPVSSSNWWNGTTLGVGTSSGNTMNCYKIASDGNSASWDYYRPAMSSASVVDNGTTKTGSGTSLSPYQVVTGATIKLSASCVSAVEDGAMTKEYKFLNKGSQVRAYSSTNTYTFTAGAAGTTYEITVTARNTYQSASGTESSASSTLYYTIIAEPEATNEVTISYKFGATTIKAYDTEDVGEETPSSISAPDITGYSFSSWSLGNGLNNKSGSTTANPISITTKASGTYTLTANYNEVLTTDWKLIGDNQSGSPFGDNYAYASGKAMSKKTGYSTTDKAYKTLNVTKLPGSYYGFKVATASGSSTEYGWGNSDGYYVTYNRSKSGTANDVYTGNQHELKFVPDGLGEYEFEVDYTATPCSVKVTFPTVYAVTYSVGSVAGTSGSISATYSSVAFSSGTKIQSGKSVTLTAPAAKSGYTWYGWCTNTNGTGRVSESATYSPTISASTTLYACYTENSYTVTVNASSGGQVSYNGGDAGSSCSASAGVATASATISAIPNTGYAFVGWTNVDADHHITNYTATWNSTNKGWDLVVKADAATTITANFAPRFALVGAIVADGNPEGGMPGWAEAAAFTYSAGTYTISRTLTSPNTGYAFKIIDRLAESWIWRGHSSPTNNLAVDNTTTYTLTENGGNNVFFDSRGVGSYTFTVVEETITGVVYPKVKIQDGANSHVVTWGYVSDNGEEGGTITSVVDGEATPNSIASGKYVKDGGSITATAAANPGYRFIDFRTSSTYGGGSQLSTSNPYTVASVKADQNIYAQFAENLCTVTITANNKSAGSITVGGEAFAWDGTTNVGVYNYKSLVVTPADGYYFSGWTLSSTPDFEVDDDGESGSSTNLRGLGGTHGSTGTLTANFKELEKIYFRNNFDDGTNPATHWDNVYVYFDVDLQDSRAKTSTVNTTENLHVAMTDKEYKNIYWAYVPRYVTKNNKTKVAFANFDYAENGYKLWPGSGSSNHGQAVYREDFKGNNNMFVPYHVTTSTSTDDAGGNTDYFNNGYWMYYTLTTGDSASYYVERRTGSGEYSGRLAAFQVLTEPWEDTKIQCRLRIDGISNDKYVIFNEAGKKYKASSAIAYDNYEDVAVVEDNASDAYFTLTPTSEGEYVITLDQSGDQMKISVNYPVAVNDYVIEHTYKGRNKANSADSTYTTRSNVIKAADASTLTRYSMYLNKNTATLKLRKCTNISAGAPVWSSGETYKLSDILTKLTSDGNGVYQFDIAVNTSTHQVSEIDSIRLYTGNFYIKTDAASGGWVAYKNNILDKNTVSFDRSKAETFDNYFCKYFASKDCNIKSVIANDYCNQLSDTVKGDGIARMVGKEPFVPVDGTSIRFSYNSATNETKRAYMGASSNNDFLSLVPSTDNKIYRTISEIEYDLYDQAEGSAQRKFADNGNWVYEMDLEVKPGGQAGVTAAYTDASSTKHVQTLINTDNTVLGGSGSTSYEIRVVYDFKTNYMMSSFILPSSEITDKLSNVDMLWVRHKDHSPQQLLLGDGGELKKVNVVAAIELRYDSVHSSGSGSGHVTMTSWTPQNRPFLKYFVSFPFDVPVNSIFGLNQADLGREYIIQHYNGAKRAKEGLFGGDDDNYWENLTKDSIMHANEGYCVIFDNDYVSGLYGHIWDNKSSGSSVYMYFPAKDTIAAITNDNKEINVKPLTCTIDRAWANNAGKNHTNTDSHWHMIGSPLFHDSQIKTNTEDASGNYPLSSYYYLDYSDNKWKSVGITKESTDFKAMSSVMVQWYGNVTWQVKPDPTPAPRRVSEALKNYQVKLDLSYNGNTPDWTYVQLREDADDDFVLREDMYKMYNSGIPQIYTFAGAYDVAFRQYLLVY